MLASELARCGTVPTTRNDCKHAFLPTRRLRGSRQPRKQSSCSARATVDRGSSGIDIQGARPTSPRAWEILCQTLEDQKVSFITPQETVFAQERGVPIIDVRPAFDHYCSRIPGSVGIPFMRAITGNSLRQNLRRAGFAFFGIFNGTEFNPFFYDEVAAAVDKEQGAVLVCGIGGVLEPLGKGGRQSRSLMAAYELASSGYQKIQVLQGGFNEWERSGRATDNEPIPYEQP